MAVSTRPSTFEFTRDWLVSSETFVREAMGATATSQDEARDEARARIHREEALDEPDDEEADDGEQRPPICPPPRVMIITRANTRKRVGTGTWAGSGQLLVAIEALVPEVHRLNGADDDVDTKREKFAARKAWGMQLCEAIRDELLTTSGRGDQNGTPYLNATDVNIHLPPSDPEAGEDDGYIGFIYEVEWR